MLFFVFEWIYCDEEKNVKNILHTTPLGQTGRCRCFSESDVAIRFNSSDLNTIGFSVLSFSQNIRSRRFDEDSYFSKWSLDNVTSDLSY